jgi:hypothetical protein
MVVQFGFFMLPSLLTDLRLACHAQGTPKRNVALGVDHDVNDGTITNRPDSVI